MSFQIEFSHPKAFCRELTDGLALGKEYSQFRETIHDPRFGFFTLSENRDLLEKSRRAYKRFSDRKWFVHIGIGGSSLGPEMLINALAPREVQKRFLFLNNIDPDEIAEQLENIEPEKCVFSFVSKSGSTAETNAVLSLITNMLKERGVAENQLGDYFVFTTDPEKSDLLTLGKKLGVTTLPIPSNVGGRYSVLTPVGLFPSLFAGIDVEKLLHGAEDIKKELLEESLEDNILLQTGAYLESLRREKSITQTVFMPYSSKLREVSFWFTQLWAESLGKEKTLDGESKHRGLTPIPAYGASDQHSQVQLFMEGPKDKCLMVVGLEQFENDFSLNSPFSTKAAQKLSRFSLGQLLRAEMQGTLKALQENDRPYIQFKLKRRDAKSIGQLILFLESLTVLMGQYLRVNPFDQPGVEAGKRYTFEWLEKLNQTP